jgi:protein-tyrosine phosphatase
VHTELFWIEGPWPGKLAISARPRGGDWLEEELRGWSRDGIDDVVSLLTPDEEESLDLEAEGNLCRENGLSFRPFPIVDRSVPSRTEAMHLIQQLDADLAKGKNLVVHCRQGIGRSGLIAAGLLVARGVSPEEAMKRASAARHVPIPETVEQRLWIMHDFPSTLSAAGNITR